MQRNDGSPQIRWFVAASLVAALALIAALPALLGDWVYDDRVLPGHPLLDGFDDVWRTLLQTSDAYLDSVRAGPVHIATGTTYRPLPMMSFALTNAVLQAEPLWHHAVSALFHVINVLLLARLFASGGQLSKTGWWVVGVFALHAGIGEAYCWINGRSDTMAGTFLLLLALAQTAAMSVARRVAISVVVLIGGALCKETFLVASAALLVASSFFSSAQRSRRELTLLAAAWITAVSSMFIGRRLAQTRPGGIPDLDLLGALSHVPRLWAVATETLLFPRAQSMRLLSWELTKPWGIGEVVALIALAAVAMFLLRTRRYRALVLLVGAVATVLPALLISGGFWFGFDRYLYMPACLIALCFQPSVDAAPTRVLSASQRRQWLASWLVSMALLAFVQHQACTAYDSHGAWLRSMVQLRPEDPSGYLFATQDALSRGKRTVARRLLSAMPRKSLPVPHAHRAVDAWLSLNEPGTAATIATDVLRNHADEPRLMIGLATARAQQQRWPEAAELYEQAFRNLSAKRSAAKLTLATRLQEQLDRADIPQNTANQLRALLNQVQASGP